MRVSLYTDEMVRLVTHRYITDADIERVLKITSCDCENWTRPAVICNQPRKWFVLFTVPRMAAIWIVLFISSPIVVFFTTKTPSHTNSETPSELIASEFG